MKSAAIFLDRDGTILNEKGYLKDPDKIKFYASAFLGLKKMAQQGFKLIVITNQSGVGRGYFSKNDVESVHRKIQETLKKKGVSIAGFFYCPHHPEQGCLCRKPQTALVKNAARRFNIDVKKSFIIGDQMRDMELAKNVGATPILVLTGFGLLTRKKIKKSAVIVTKNLLSAAHRIIRE